MVMEPIYILTIEDELSEYLLTVRICSLFIGTKLLPAPHVFCLTACCWWVLFLYGKILNK